MSLNDLPETPLNILFNVMKISFLKEVAVEFNQLSDDDKQSYLVVKSLNFFKRMLNDGVSIDDAIQTLKCSSCDPI